MSGATITTATSDIQERLSLAYLTAVAARAGCQLMETKVDRNGIDASIRPIAGAPVCIDVQMKSVAQNIRINGGANLSFQLDTPTYDKLRRSDTQAPQLLVVYEMPSTQADWLRVSHPRTELQHAAYWCDLRGKAAVTTNSVAVHLSTSDVFDHNAISTILAKAHSRAMAGLAWG